MPIISISDTTVDFWCFWCGPSSVQTVGIATLTAGVATSPNAIRSPVCLASPNNHAECLARTWDNPTVHAGMVNGLHRALVTAAQIHPDQIAYLTTEPNERKPRFHYALSATARTISLGVNGELQWDLDALVDLRGAEEAKKAVRLGLVYPDRDDSAVSLWINSLYASPGDQDRWATVVKANRVKAELP